MIFSSFAQNKYFKKTFSGFFEILNGPNQKSFIF